MNYTAISIDDAVNQILSAPAPILLPDTCTLLDLIRVPFREDNAKTAMQILNAATDLAAQTQTSPPNLWVVIPPLVHGEWTEHSQPTIDELQRHWSRLDTKIKIAHASAKAVNVSLPNAITYSSQNIENHLVSLSHSFFNNAIFLAEDSYCVKLAYERAIHRKEPPSRRGGELKDCVIIEHCIELCSQLQTSGFTEMRVFTTSNTRDFCESNRTVPKGPLGPQLSGANLFLATSWQWTKAKLGV